MKVLLLNGSPRKEGCTFTALSEVAKTLNHNGIDTEIFQAGNPDTDNVKAAAAKLKEADALIVGSPVYWASPSGQIIEFMDKLCSMAGKDMLHKPAAAVASARRAGTTATLDVLQKYFSYHEMPVVSANYLSLIHIFLFFTLGCGSSHHHGGKIYTCTLYLQRIFRKCFFFHICNVFVYTI